MRQYLHYMAVGPIERELWQTETLPGTLAQSDGRGVPLWWRVVTIGERVAALLLLFALLPLLLALGLVIAVLSSGPPLIALARAGRHGRCIWLLKLRTMWGSESEPRRGGGLLERMEVTLVPVLKTGSDPRVTNRLAAFCRRYSIDELPQLWHVVRGEMALVGPRPLTFAELDAYYGVDANEVLNLKPGLTGLWQVKGRNSLSYAERLALDLYLVRNWSPRLYLSVLCATIPAVLSGRNAG